MLIRQAGQLRDWVKRRETPLARAAYSIAKGARTIQVPLIPGVHALLYALHHRVKAAFAFTLRAIWYTPLFQSRLQRPAEKLFLYEGLPSVLGPVEITLGSNCRVCGVLTISGRSKANPPPQLLVGDNVDLGWGGNIAVGSKITIGNNVRLAPGVSLIGYPGHPIEPNARARGESETDDQVGEIVLEDDVWLGTRVIVMPGVRIGRGTIVGAGSVVTKNLPEMIVAAGNPAQVKRRI